MVSQRWATWLFIAGVVGARIAMGLFFNVTGPTLPTLAKNVNVDVSTVSWIFTVRSIAFFAGAATATKLFKVMNPLILMTLSTWGLAACLIVIPIINEFWLLCIMILIPGICAGFIDAGLQAIILEVWGPEKSRPLIQSFHFMYTIGAFLAPLIMNPFLAKANEGDCSTEAACPGEIVSDDDMCEQGEDAQVYILYGFAVTCGFTCIVGVFWILLTCWKVLDQIREDHQDTADQREEEDFKTIWPFLLAVFLFFFNIETTEVIYASYIYDYARCSDRAGGFESSSASQLLTIFWGMMMFGRLVGIFLATKLSPTIYAYIDLLVASVAIVLLGIEPITGKEMTYTVTAIIGFAMSTVYGSGVSMTAKRINVSDSYMWVFFFSAQLIPMMNPVLCSYLMESDSENFVYMNITTTVLGLLCIPLVTHSYRYLRNKGVLKAPSNANTVGQANQAFDKDETDSL